MTTYAWSPAYEIDHGEIDAQHRQLLELANLVRQAVQEHHGDAVLTVLGQGFKALEKAALHHFAAEEARLERLGSPLMDAHRRLHAQILREARAIHQDIMENRGRRTADLAGAVEVWMLDRLITHIVRDDRAAFDAART